MNLCSIQKLTLIFAPAILLSLAFGKPQKVISPQEYKKQIDAYTYAHIDSFRYFAMTKTSAKPFRVMSKRWPENMIKSYSVLANRAGKIIFAMVEQDGEWGDYAITYRYYFDEEGKTKSFQKGNHFYHSVCVNNDAIDEKRIYYYDTSFKRINEEYSLISGDGKVLDSMRCDFPYNLPFKIYRSWKELKQAENL
jgi:hypothetical protein